MTTDLERLKAWMVAHDYDSKGLSRKMSYFGDCVKNVVAGKVAINHSFRHRFGYTFGRAELDSVFQDNAVPQCLNEFGNWQEHGKAHGAVNKAIRTGQMPHPSALKCHGCDEQAQLYHHESYRPEDHLCVTPLCRKCHRQHHSGKRVLSFGVVPTHVGLVRIAIAGA